tara:strand:+ start:228 stop:563 length:336 start_codon:yes stop_codon:yes gene_type:complete
MRHDWIAVAVASSNYPTLIASDITGATSVRKGQGSGRGILVRNMSSPLDGPTPIETDSIRSQACRPEPHFIITQSKSAIIFSGPRKAIESGAKLGRIMYFSLSRICYNRNI